MQPSDRVLSKPFLHVGFALGALSLGVVASVAEYEAVFIAGAVASVVGGLLLTRMPTQLRTQAANAS